jgi:2-amino-4-hydroxy-6-hydroxymethyldihydropteridine diphosphokinase
MPICYLGLGSNLGQREKKIRLAVKEIAGLKDTKVLRLSRIIETKPIGGPARQRMFLNAVLKVRTRLKPLDLLKRLKLIECSLGRKKTVRWGPRAIDLDILFYGQQIICCRQLKIPHPKVFQRPFVFGPLLEVLW